MVKLISKNSSGCTKLTNRLLTLFKAHLLADLSNKAGKLDLFHSSDFTVTMCLLEF